MGRPDVVSGPFGETVVISRVSGVTQDRYGNDVESFTSDTVHGVTIGPSTSTELVQGQALLTDELHAIFIPAIPLSATDQIEVVTGFNAATYTIDGHPKQYHSSLTGTSVTDAKLLVVTG